MKRLLPLRKIATLPVSVALRHAGNIVRTRYLIWKKVKLEDELQGHLVTRGAFFPEAVLRAHMTGSKETAERICVHEFDLLGSGVQKLGNHINWQTPFSNQGRLNEAELIKKSSSLLRAHSASAKAEVKEPRNQERLNEAELIKKDIKLAWELSRFQFLPTLARAYEIHHDENYALEAKELIHDWIIKNPLGKGTNWQITMEAAIRACNFALAWYFLRQSPPWKSDEWRKAFLTSITEHGKFIYRNLEYGPGFNTNHFLADITGLFFLGVLFPQFREARKWKAKALHELNREMQKQVYEDGVDFEASIPYHRLACEFFGYSALLAQTNEIWLPVDFLRRLEKMFEFAWYYTKPNRLAPQIGDNDDGRLFIFADFYSWERRDHRELFWLAAELFPQNPKFSSAAVEKTSKGFNFSGIYIMRKNDFYCIVDCGSNGQAGNGGHAHNDTLSFELTIGGEDFFIDPGAYVYTSDPSARKHFRSTAMHNTVMIEGQEMNRFMKGEVFRIYNDTIPQVNRWDSDEMHDFLDVEHSGYERLKTPVTHHRTFYFDKKNLSMEITDCFVGRGTHEIQWNFHFDPGVTIEKVNTKIIAQKNGQTLEMVLPSELVQYVSIHDGEVSPRYGVKEKGKVLKIAFDFNNIDRQSFRFLFKMIIT